MSDHVITLNAGSSSIKFALFAVAPQWPLLVASGQIDGLGARPAFHSRKASGEIFEASVEAIDHEAAIAHILRWLAAEFPSIVLRAVGHRIVHGGLDYAAPCLINDAVVAKLREFEPLAPLHQPHNLAGVAAARAAFPDAPQIACFDTAFHRGHEFVNEAYALPRRYYERGVRRFGFHGISYEYIARRMRELDLAQAGGRVIIAHLGAGASLCALRDGRSVATTMGFSALDGLPMGTRCGGIDPGLLLYFLDHDRMAPKELSRLLYQESGLKGLSGVSADMRALELSADPQAAEAIDYFAHRVRIEIGGLTAALGGLDALVFTAGIGEHSPAFREKVVAPMAWLHMKLDAAANARGDRLISTTESIPLYVIATNEEAMIARHAIELLAITE